LIGDKEILNYPKKWQDAIQGAIIIKIFSRNFSRLWSKEGTKELSTYHKKCCERYHISSLRIFFALCLDLQLELCDCRVSFVAFFISKVAWLTFFCIGNYHMINLVLIVLIFKRFKSCPCSCAHYQCALHLFPCYCCKPFLSCRH